MGQSCIRLPHICFCKQINLKLFIMRKFISFFVAALFSATMFGATYTVAGDQTVLGSHWDINDANNEMTLVNGVYTLVKENLTLSAREYEYKVVKDHNWDAMQMGNQKFTVSENGIYNVTFTFNESVGISSISAVADKKGDAEIDPTVSIKGSWDGWNAEVKFTLAEDKKSATVKKIMDAKTYEFKVIVNGGWRSNEGTINRENPSAAGITENLNANINLVADMSGEYTFTWTFETNTLVVTFPEESIPIEHTYTVAGTPASLFGTEWDPSNADNDMTKQEDGSYKWEQKNLALAVGDIKFKVVEDRDWANAYPASDYVLNIAEAATYTLTITFNNGEVSALAVKEGDTPAVLPTVAIAGAMNEWNVEANVMVAAEDGLTASVTMVLPAEEVEFKVVVNGHWLAKDAIYDITRVNPTVENVDQEIPLGPNLRLKADAEGEYVFTWTYATNTLVVTFPEAGPVVDQPKFYVTGNKELVGDPELAWKPAAIQSMTDTLELNLNAGIDYELKVNLNGTWEGENNVKGFGELTEVAEGLNDVGNDHNIGFRLAEDGVVKVIYIAATDEQPEVFKLIGNFSKEVPPVTPDGYYLVGTITGWSVVPDAPHTFQSTAVEGEYILHFTLTEGDAIKVVGVENGTETWYPEGMGTEYTVDADHAGEKEIYFRPAGNAEWTAFGGFIYIAPNTTPEEAIINTQDGIKAVKTIENGQIVIIKAGVRYNVLGTRL